MSTNKILKKVHLVFGKLSKPKRIYSLEPYVETPDSYRLNLQEEFHGLEKEALGYEKCSILIFEYVLISDEAFRYFLPRLTEHVFYESQAFLDTFYHRLERIDRSNLTEEENGCINELIEVAKAFEKEVFDDE